MYTPWEKEHYDVGKCRAAAAALDDSNNLVILALAAAR
jgi:hypothetical protein